MLPIALDYDAAREDTHADKDAQGHMDDATISQRTFSIATIMDPQMLCRLEGGHLWKYELTTSAG